MKSIINNSIQKVATYLPLFILVLLLSSIVIVSFHDHNCSEDFDNCSACRLQQSFSSLSIEPTTNGIILHKSLSETIPILNEQTTDPSQKIVCSSHAPPENS